MQADPTVDLVVTTGYWLSGNRRRIHIPDITRHQNDSLNGMIERCWLASCGGLYRASSVSQHYFDGLPDLCEWTYLAFRLAVDRPKVRFLDLPTYNMYDTPGSLSKTEAFLEATLRVLRAMRSQRLPAAGRAQLERKYRAALHDAAEHYRKAKQLGKAWRFHLQSMKPPYALRYGAYTRKLLWTRKTSADERSLRDARCRRKVRMISVVICTRDQSLQARAVSCSHGANCGDAGFAWQLVVVDNASEDDTNAVIERFAGALPLVYAFEAKPGLSHARNRGIAAARYPVIAFTDDDCLVGADWLRAIVAEFADPARAFGPGRESRARRRK